MKRLFSSVFITLTLCSSLFAQSFGEWIPLNQLVKESDLIVSGTLYSVSKYTNDSIDYSEGIIVVEEFISGNVETIEGLPLKVKDKVKLTWHNPSAKIYDRIELGGSEGNEVIWILKVKSDGTVTANNYVSMRSAGTNSRKEVKETLRKDRKRRDLQKVKLFDETNPNVTNQNRQTESSETNPSHIVEVQSKISEYSPLAALITILFSLSFYWIFYQSKFRIR